MRVNEKRGTLKDFKKSPNEYRPCNIVGSIKHHSRSVEQCIGWCTFRENRSVGIIVEEESSSAIIESNAHGLL